MVKNSKFVIFGSSKPRIKTPKEGEIITVITGFPKSKISTLRRRLENPKTKIAQKVLGSKEGRKHKFFFIRKVTKVEGRKLGDLI